MADVVKKRFMRRKNIEQQMQTIVLTIFYEEVKRLFYKI